MDSYVLVPILQSRNFEASVALIEASFYSEPHVQIFFWEKNNLHLALDQTSFFVNLVRNIDFEVDQIIHLRYYKKKYLNNEISKLRKPEQKRCRVFVHFRAIFENNNTPSHICCAFTKKEVDLMDSQALSN